MPNLEYHIGDIVSGRRIIDLFYSQQRHKNIASVICERCGKIAKLDFSSLKAGVKCRCSTYKYDDIKSKDRLYRIWSHIKDRCYNNNCDRYYLYGAKGIQMCEEWKNDFISFAQWSWEHGYEDSLTIDRIDSTKNYCPENCQWITRGDNTTKSNKISQHRKANRGLYYYCIDNETGSFENANEFARLHNLDASKIRYYSNANIGKEEKLGYNGWIFWHEK